MLHDTICPTVVHLVGDVQLPVNREQESHLILVDLLGVKPRNLTPGARRVVAILQILGCQDQSREEHATTALKNATRMAVVRLFHGEVMIRHMGLDQYQIVESNLQCGVTRARAAQSLLDESAQGQNAIAASLSAANHRRRGPDSLDDLCGRI